jgi:hypothetical protein
MAGRLGNFDGTHILTAGRVCEGLVVVCDAFVEGGWVCGRGADAPRFWGGVG